MSNRTFSKPLTHAILILFLALLFTAVLLPLTSQDAHAAVIADEPSYTLTDDGILTIKSNSFNCRSAFDRYGSPANGKKALVRKIIFGEDVTVIMTDMTGGYNGSKYTCGSSDDWGYFGNTEEVVIRNGVTTIQPHAFDGYYNLEKVTIPKSVDSIGSFAFMNCTALRELTIPGDVTTIKDYAFSACTNLRTVKITGSVNTIGEAAFTKDTALREITLPDSVTSIEYMAFQNCSALQTIKLPTNLDTIGSYAFKGCSALKSITIPKGVTTIREYSFYQCGSLTSVTFQGPLAVIEKSGFDSSGLTSVTLPKTLNTLGQWAFANCERLRSLTFKGATAISGMHEQAFENVVATGYYPDVDKLPALMDKFYYAYHNGHYDDSRNYYSSNNAKVRWVGTNIPISKCTITGINSSYNYTGKAITPTVAVKINGTTLRKGTDYTVSYANNVKVGTATVTIKGKGNYTGSVKKTFKIVKKASSTKLAGANRYETAQSIADQLKKENGGKKFSTIVVASGDTYPDALAGVYLAKVKSAP
nr:leucine-rich repeat protein [Clostridia bacterium]